MRGKPKRSTTLRQVVEKMRVSTNCSAFDYCDMFQPIVSCQIVTTCVLGESQNVLEDFDLVLVLVTFHAT